MRLGIIAAASSKDGANPAAGERDALLVSERLALPDLGFQVHALDPSSDMAGQLDALLSDHAGEIEEVFVYASARVVTLEDGESFLCLDVDNPNVGDALRDVAAALFERASCPVLVVVEARHDATELADLRAAAAAVRDCIDPATTGIEVIVSARNVDAHIERIPSRFTVGFLEEIDGRDGPLVAKQVYASIVQHADLGHWAHAELYASGRQSVSLREPPRGASPPSAASPAPSGKATAAGRAPSPAVEPPPPPVRSPRKPPADSPDVPVFIPPPVPVPDALLAAAQGAQSAPASRESQSGKARRPAPPSERTDAATVTVTRQSKAQPAPEASLPKVVIDANIDPRKRPTIRKIDVDVKAVLAEAKGGSRERRADAKPEGAAEASPPPPPKRAPKTLQSEGAHPANVEPTELDSADVESERALDSERTSTTEARPSVTEASAPRPSSPRPSKKVTDWTVDEHMAVGDEHFQLGKTEQALAEFKKALGKLGSAASPARAELYVRIAEVNRRQKNSRLALSNFEKALVIVPDMERAHAGVLACLLDQRNWKAVKAAEDKLLDALPPGDEARLERRLEFAERADANEARDRALEHLRLAREEFPRDQRPLERLLEIHESAGDEAEVLALRRALVEFIEHPGERAQAMCDVADACLEAGDDEEALRLYELVLDADPSFLEALDRLASTLADNQEWAELERIYRKMVEAYSDETDGPSRTLVCELHRKLALLFRDHLEDPEQALDALDDELALRPNEPSAHLIAAELTSELDNPARALVHLRKVTVLEPTRIEAYRQMFRLGRRYNEPETTFLAASVLDAVAAANPEESAHFEDHRVQGVPGLRRPMRREAWSWLRGDSHDLALDRVMKALSPAVVRARVRDLEAKGKLPELPEPHDPKTSTASVVRTIGWAGQFLGVALPAIYLDDKVATPISARFAKHPALIVGKGAMRGRSMGELAFFAARHLALCVPEYELVHHMHTIDELTACVLAGLKLVLGAAPSGPLATTVEKLASTISRELDDDEHTALDRAVRELASRSSHQLDLTAWVASVERCATRAGYLLCGDLQLALQLLRAEGDTTFTTAQDRISDLLTFAVSGNHVKLRQELGSSLVEHAEPPRLSSPPRG